MGEATLTDIVSKGQAASLIDAGIGTVKALSELDPLKLADLKGFGAKSAPRLIEKATAALVPTPDPKPGGEKGEDAASNKDMPEPESFEGLVMGRVVLFTPSGRSRSYAALVDEVIDIASGRVSLTYFCPQEFVHGGRQSAVYVGRVPYDGDGAPGSWRWPR